MIAFEAKTIRARGCATFSSKHVRKTPMLIVFQRPYVRVRNRYEREVQVYTLEQSKTWLIVKSGWRHVSHFLLTAISRTTAFPSPVT